MHNQESFEEPIHSIDKNLKLFDQLPSLMWRSGLNAECDWFNTKWLRFTGRTIQQEIGNGWTDGIHPEDLERYLNIYFSSFEAQIPFEMYYRLRHYTGQYRWIRVFGQSFSDDAGNFAGYLGTCYDIHEGKEAEQAIKNLNIELEEKVNSRTFELEKQKEIIFSIFKKAPAMIAITRGENLVYELANSLYLKAVGKTSDIIGKTILEVFPELKGQPIYKILEDVYKTGERYVGKETLIKLDVKNNGTPQDTYFDFVYEPYFDTEGNVIGILNHAIEVTDQVLSRKKLEASEERFKTVINNAPLVMWSVDTNGIYTFSEGKALADLGLKPGELIGKSHYEIYKDFPESIEPVKRALKGEIIRTMPHFEGRYYDSYYSPLKDHEDNIIGAVAISTDITEQKKFQLKLEESEERFRAMADNIPNLAWMADPEGAIFWYNKRWFDYTGTTAKEMEGWGWQSVHDPIELPNVIERWTASIKTGSFFEMVFPLRGADQVYRSFLTRVIPLKDSNGNILRWFGTNTDITEQIKSEKDLQSKNAELVKINNDLDNFIYTASHDLRAPVSNIEGLINNFRDVLKTEKIENKEEAVMLLEMMEASTSKFKHTILDLTEISKLQKLVEEDLTIIKCDQIYQDIRLTILNEIVKTNAKIFTDFSDCPEFRFSKKNLHSIMYNLISNSIKYKDPNRDLEIMIKTESNDGYIILSVADNGIGISKENHGRMFGMFKRFHDHVEGSGIGLYIVKRIIDNAGGKIEVDSEVGKGTTFKIYLRLV